MLCTFPPSIFIIEREGLARRVLEPGTLWSNTPLSFKFPGPITLLLQVKTVVSDWLVPPVTGSGGEGFGGVLARGAARLPAPPPAHRGNNGKGKRGWGGGGFKSFPLCDLFHSFPASLVTPPKAKKKKLT